MTEEEVFTPTSLVCPACNNYNSFYTRNIVSHLKLCHGLDSLAIAELKSEITTQSKGHCHLCENEVNDVLKHFEKCHTDEYCSWRKSRIQQNLRSDPIPKQPWTAKTKLYESSPILRAIIARYEISATASELTAVTLYRCFTMKRAKGNTGTVRKYSEAVRAYCEAVHLDAEIFTFDQENWALPDPIPILSTLGPEKAHSHACGLIDFFSKLLLMLGQEDQFYHSGQGQRAKADIDRRIAALKQERQAIWKRVLEYRASAAYIDRRLKQDSHVRYLTEKLRAAFKEGAVQRLKESVAKALAKPKQYRKCPWKFWELSLDLLCLLTVLGLGHRRQVYLSLYVEDVMRGIAKGPQDGYVTIRTHRVKTIRKTARPVSLRFSDSDLGPWLVKFIEIGRAHQPHVRESQRLVFFSPFARSLQSQHRISNVKPIWQRLARLLRMNLSKHPVTFTLLRKVFATKALDVAKSHIEIDSIARERGYSLSAMQAHYRANTDEVGAALTGKVNSSLGVPSSETPLASNSETVAKAKKFVATADRTSASARLRAWNEIFGQRRTWKRKLNLAERLKLAYFYLDTIAKCEEPSLKQIKKDSLMEGSIVKQLCDTLNNFDWGGNRKMDATTTLHASLRQLCRDKTKDDLRSWFESSIAKVHLAKRYMKIDLENDDVSEEEYLPSMDNDGETNQPSDENEEESDSDTE